jgi:hypothetical protein
VATTLRFFLAAGLGLVGSMWGRPAGADGAAPRPLEIGLSGGYSNVGFGDRGQGSADLGSLWAIPLLLDVDYRLSKHWSVGAYGEVGFIDDDKGDVSGVEETIRGHHYRVGAEAIFRVQPGRRFEPWLGFGLGYDALTATHVVGGGAATLDGDASGPDSAIRARGFELGHVQLGVDFALLPALALGPFAGASMVSYGKRRGFVRDDSVNVWSNVGLKATLRL